MPAMRQAAASLCAHLIRAVRGESGHDAPGTLQEVLTAERTEIASSRRVRYDWSQSPSNPHETYVGLALSGGGIRSATVSLGILQGLHALGVLRTIDYLSTVSGGGFIGGWWTAWLARQRANCPLEVRPDAHFPPAEGREPERAPNFERHEEPPDGSRFAGRDPIHHLRLFANYLTPRKGLLSADTWRAAAVFARNLSLTWLVLLPVLCAVVLIGQLYYVAQPFDDRVVRDFVHADEIRLVVDAANLTPEDIAENREEDRDFHGLDASVLWPRVKVAARPMLALLLVMLVVTAIWMHFNNAGGVSTHAAIGLTLAMLLACGVLAWNPMLAETRPPPARSLLAGRAWDLGVGVLVLCASAWIAWRINRRGGDGMAVSKQTRAARATVWLARLLTIFSLTGFVLAFAGFAHEFLIATVFNILEWSLPTWKEKLAVLTTLAGVVTTLYSVFVSAPTGGKDRRDVEPPSLPSRLILAVAPPLALVLLAAAAALAMHWILFVVLFDASAYPTRLDWLRIGAWTSLGLALWLATWENVRLSMPARRVPMMYFAFTILIYLGLAPGMPTARLFGPLGFTAGSLLLLGVALAAFVVLGLLRLAGRSTRVRSLLGFVIVFLLVYATTLWADAGGARASSLRLAFCVLAGFIGWILALGWAADPNALSLHTFYKARLVRAYLGASNAMRNRERHDIAEPDPYDDVRLREIDASRSGGPYHLVNTTLNLIGGRDLVTAQRWSANYVLASRYCGSTRTGYRPTDQYMGGELTLGAAVAASGAAVSPNMGAATPSAALALLLAAFNIRLGLWVPTPRRASWMLPQMWIWPYYLLREALSQTNDLGSHCYLTDGGHFDNTGLYSLVERGCRYIIVADNGADPHRCFADIGEAIRRCRIDFGAEIKLDTQAFRPADGKAGTVHVAYGTIEYHREHLAMLGWTHTSGPEALGRLVWIKPTVLPGDAADVRQYQLENDKFPQQTTADQWFGESQFESYRKLGELSALAAFGAVDTAALHQPLTAQRVAEVFAPVDRTDAAPSNGGVFARLRLAPTI